MTREEAIEQLQNCKDLISRADAIERFCEYGTSLERQGKTMITMVDAKYAFIKTLESLPSADRPSGEWSVEEVAELLADLFDDEYACNYNGIDEWLPQSCKYADTECPDPKEKHGCWIQFLKHRGAKMGSDTQ